MCCPLARYLLCVHAMHQPLCAGCCMPQAQRICQAAAREGAAFQQSQAGECCVTAQAEANQCSSLKHSPLAAGRKAAKKAVPNFDRMALVGSARSSALKADVELRSSLKLRWH